MSSNPMLFNYSSLAVEMQLNINYILFHIEDFYINWTKLMRMFI